MTTKYNRSELDREARLVARNYRKEQDPKKNYRGSRAKVEYWEIAIHPDSRHISFIVHLDNGAWITCAI